MKTHAEQYTFFSRLLPKNNIQSANGITATVTYLYILHTHKTLLYKNELRIGI